MTTQNVGQAIPGPQPPPQGPQLPQQADHSHSQGRWDPGTANFALEAAGDNASETALEGFSDQFDADEDDWYIAERALEQGLNPIEATRHVRRVQRTRLRVAKNLGTPHDYGPSPSPNVGAQGRPALAEPITCPPGFAGAIAQFIYRAAPRPVAEVAVVAALGLLAGICGREWTIPGSGLNIYVVLVARSGVGKEAMHRGIAKLVAAARKRYALADQFVSYDDVASGPALVKLLLNAPCSVNVAGEIGHKFSAMAKDNESAMRSLRRTMTNLYSKSGPDNVAGGIAYSNQENNVGSIEGASYSLIGETTPGTFFESITRGMMEDGFMSRFNVVEYRGDRPEKNPALCDTPEETLVDHIVALMRHAHLLRGTNKFQNVIFSPTAQTSLDAFEQECDDAIRRAGDDEGHRQMWNRAHLKVLRIAALLAVADNYLFPTVSDQHVRWAINLLRQDIGVFARRIKSGEVGEGSDDGRERKLLELCREYLLAKSSDLPAYGKKWNSMREAGFVTRNYLQIRTQRLAAFEKHPRGHKAALDMAIQTAIDNGNLIAVSNSTTVELHGFHGKIYGVITGNGK